MSTNIKLTINTAIAVVHELNQKSSDARCKALIKDLTNLMMDATDNKAEPLKNAVAPIDILAALLGCDSTVEGVECSVRYKLRDAERAENDLAYLRYSFKQIAGMLGLKLDSTPAYIVEQIGVQLKHNGTKATLASVAAECGIAPHQPVNATAINNHIQMLKNTLQRLGEVSGFSETDSLPQMVDVLRYRKEVTKVADTIAENSNLDTAVYLVKMHDKLVEANEQCDKWHGIAMKDEQKLAQLKEIDWEYPCHASAEAHRKMSKVLNDD